MKQIHIRFQVFPSFSRNKKNDLFRDVPLPKNNTSDVTSGRPVGNPGRNTLYTSENPMNDQVGVRRNKLKVKKKIEKVVKTELNGVDMHTPENPVNNQIVGSKDKVMNKRKALKGLKTRMPAKIQKNNRGEKRLLPSDWQESERKKNKKYNIVRINPNYDMWKLYIVYI